MSRRIRLVVIVSLTVVFVVVIVLLPPIPQFQISHVFADRRTILGIPNFLDVISNVPFILVGILGLIFLWHQGTSDAGGAFLEKSEQLPYAVFFGAVFLTCFGSTYYHLAPDNTRLVWDRLAIALAFMSFFSAIIAERISAKAGLRLLLPLLAVGIGSVVYWYLSELRGEGNLRPYIAVQGYAMLVIPFILCLFPPRYTRSRDILIVLALYVIAKILEILDLQVFNLGRLVSGHTLKHFVAGLAAYWILYMLRNREPMPVQLHATPSN